MNYLATSRGVLRAEENQEILKPKLAKEMHPSKFSRVFSKKVQPQSQRSRYSFGEGFFAAPTPPCTVRLRRVGAWLAIPAVILLVFTFLPSPSALAVVGGGSEIAEDLFVPGEVIIKFKSEIQALKSSFLTRHGLLSAEDIFKQHRANKSQLLATGPGNFYLAKLKNSIDLSEALLSLQLDRAVEYAEPNYIVSAALTPNDPSFASLYGLNNTGQTGGKLDADIDAPEAWEMATTTNLVIGVIDTGIDYTHEDLASNIWINPGEVAGNGLDDDLNGFVDDIRGWDFVNNDNNPFDDHGHGTHVAGTIAAVGNNGLGVVGVNWSGKVAALKFLAASGSGTIADAIRATQYANQMGFKITSNSWGGGPFSQALFDAIAAANTAGNLFVAAAGNNGTNNVLFPAAYDLPNIISVAATDHNDLKAGFSSFNATLVDLGAPGVNVLSTVPQGLCALCVPTGYGSLSGTSMATPHVSGAAALLWAKQPVLGHLDVKNKIMNLSDPIAALQGITVSGGRLNVFNTLDADAVPPGVVTDLTATAQSQRSIQLTWTAVGDDGAVGTASRYDLRYATAPIDATNFDLATQVVGEPKPSPAGTVESVTVTGLSPATTYHFRLKVSDNVGNISPLSNAASATTMSLVVVFADAMESGVNGWVVEGSDGGGGGGLWHQSQRRSVSPIHSWYYGKEATGNYETPGARNFGSLTSPSINLSGLSGTELSFFHHLTTENGPNSPRNKPERFDRATINVVKPDGIATSLASRITTNGLFVKEVFDLSAFDGLIIKLRLTFDTGDDKFNNFEGWYIDDLKVVGGSAFPPPPPPPNTKPLANANGPYSGTVGQAVVFSGLGSLDPEGQALSYKWNFGDGTTVTTPNATTTHTYLFSGLFNVSLVVNDSTLDSDPAATTATITAAGNQSPIANAGPDQTALTYSPVNFDARLSHDPDGSIVSYLWDFGDGSTGNEAVMSHTYLNPGTFTAVLAVTDNLGATGTDTAVVTVSLAPPVTVFSDSFEVSEWNGLWNEDVQNDWSRTNQQKKDGSFSAQFAGPGTDAQLVSLPVNLQGRIRATASFFWFLEKTMDLGEYAAFDVSTDGGTTWVEKLKARGGIDKDGWVSTSADLLKINTLQLRFRGFSSEALERAFVDAVQVTAW